MKMKWIVLSAAVVCVALVIAFSGLLYERVEFQNVKEVQLRTYDHVNRGEVVLTDEESQQIIRLYNNSWRTGEVTAEPCCNAFTVYIYFTDGRVLSVGEGMNARVIVRPSQEESYYLENQKLIDYIYELAERYDIPVE